MHKLLGLMLAAALAAPAADSGLLNLAMPDARVIAGVNLHRVRSSPFGQFVLNRISEQEDESFRRFVNETGFDPRRDLEEIVFAAPGGRGETRKLILARGAFDPPRLLDRAVSSGARLTTYNGVDIAVRRQFMAFAFLDSTTAVIGDIDTVRGAIDRRQGSPGLSPDLTLRIDALSAAQDAWFVSQVPLSELAGQLPETTAGGAMKGDALKAVEGASGGLKFGEAVDVSAEIVARTPQDAAALADAVRFLASLVQTQRRPGTEQIGPVLNSLDIKTAGNILTIGLMIPEGLIESNFHVSPQAGR